MGGPCSFAGRYACYCSAVDEPVRRQRFEYMSRFTEFKFYWEDWEGYPDRDYPFGNATLGAFGTPAPLVRDALMELRVER